MGQGEWDAVSYLSYTQLRNIGKHAKPSINVIKTLLNHELPTVRTRAKRLLDLLEKAT